MKVLKDAIYAKYLGNADLVAALTNGLHFQTAPDRQPYPYTTYFIVSDIPGRTFTEKMENILFQFNIFSDTPDDAEIENIFDKLIACYDDCRTSLHVSGYHTIYVDRELSQLLFDEAADIYQYAVGYRCELQEMLVINCDATYYAQAADGTIHDITTQDISVSMWVKVEVGSAANQVLLSKHDGTTGYRLYLDGGQHKLLIEDGAKKSYIWAGSDIRDGLWHHVAVYFDRSSPYISKIFTDGVDDTAIIFVAGAGAPVTLSNTQKLHIGASAGPANILDGIVTDAKLYYAVGAHWSAVQIVYQAANPFDYTSLSGTITEYWQCTEGSGVTLNGSADNDLTLTSANVWVEDGPP